MTPLKLIILILALLIPNYINAEWISLKSSKQGISETQSLNRQAPEIQIIEENKKGMTLKVDLSGFEITETPAAGDVFHKIDLLSNTFSIDNPGSPEIPGISRMIAVPDNARLSVEVVETGEKYTFDGYNIFPKEATVIESAPHLQVEANPNSYSSSVLYPKDIVKIEPPVKLRDLNLTRVSVNPVRFLADKKQLEAYSSITLRIDYDYSGSSKKIARKPISPSFHRLYKSIVYNYDSILSADYMGFEQGNDLMLCIMPDDFEDEFQEYAEWKRRSGIDIKVVTFSDIGANSENHTIIKDFISNAYHNWDIPPSYVLMIGDYGYFPVKYVVYPDYTFINEDYFVAVDGDDYFPDMFVGRIPVQSESRLKVILRKLLDYEREPFVGDTQWFKKAVVCSNNAYESQVETKRFTTQVMLQDGGFTSVDTLWSDGRYDPNNPQNHGRGCTVDLRDIKSALNKGRSFLNYRGEAWVRGWSTTCYSFRTDDLYDLQNGPMLTFVSNIGCGCAKFDDDEGNCFGEAWLKLGTESSPRGASAFVGPTSNTHTTYNNRIDKGMYVGFFREGMESPGEALVRGKIYMRYVFGDDPWVKYHSNIYCTFGDPSIRLWKDVPRDIDVVKPAFIPIGMGQSQFRVTFSSDDTPVANAQVCLTSEDIFETAYTDSNGVVIISTYIENEGEINLTVRGSNVYPYLNAIPVKGESVYVYPHGNHTIVDTDGNTDGMPNPGETCEVTFNLMNSGLQKAKNVNATLISEDESYAEVLTSGPVSAGDINPGSNEGKQVKFEYRVNAECSVSNYIPFRLDISSDQGGWDYNIPERVNGCELEFSDYLLEEESVSINNNRLDPGEKGRLRVMVINVGNDVADKVTGLLWTADPYIRIIDSTAYIGTLQVDVTSSAIGDYFLIEALPDCPEQYKTTFYIELSNNEGSYKYKTLDSFEIEIAMPNSSDVTGPDDFGYYAYSSSDTRYKQSPEYNWFSIENIGEEIELGSDYKFTYTYNMPFKFKYYGRDYNKIRISSDGWVAFGSGNQILYQNRKLPSEDEVNCMIAPYWSNIWLYGGWGQDRGKVYYYYDQSRNRFIVEWNDVKIYTMSESNYKETFQLILLDPRYYSTQTGNGDILFQYKELHSISSGSVGIENHNQDDGLNYVHKGIFDRTATFISNGIAIRVTTEEPELLVSVENTELPDGFVLDQNYPNPFNPETSISYSIPYSAYVSLRICDINGSLVRELVSDFQTPGAHKAEWDGNDMKGRKLTSGVYYYYLEMDGQYKQMKKMVLEK